MIKIRQPLCFSEIGKKDNQEDYLFPKDADTATRTFILCDGMGGHDNGEVASMTAANALGNFLSSCSEVDIPTFEAALAKAYDELDSIDTNSNKKPGTTMTCLSLNEDNYLVAHIGDSRIYHIRPSLYDAKSKRGGIIYQSSDHSLVNDLLKAGEIDEEEARNFPQKNVITRAMQPQLEKRYKADIYTFDDIRGGDYFFLCCDGILEQLSNEKLCEILADKKLNDIQKLTEIKNICDGNTRDNYSCWLIPIEKVKLKDSAWLSQVIQADSEEEDEKKQKKEASIRVSDKASLLKKKSKRLSNRFWWVLTVMAALLILLGVYLAYGFFDSSKSENIEKTEIKPKPSKPEVKTKKPEVKTNQEAVL